MGVEIIAKHEVKCAVCGVTFDTNLIQAVKYSGRRYAHASCCPDNKDFVPLGPESDPDLIKLKDYISQVYGDKANWSLITRQIKKFTTEQGYSYSGILKSLVFFYEVKHNNIEQSKGGIGIVPFVYNDAKNYYYAIWLAQQANNNKTLTTKIKEFIIKPPKMRGTKNRLLEWEDEDGE